ncbi:hypothetical protein BK816_03515 [Boudabousia tangfeifanii]|uniref:Nuclease SbcCD subunit C n=1 Tax=Boudabousia tangfeifanii TaxID=1912795 RepID=A0A1D9MJJ5_9ACTO|nr:SMC family ATPase [Boudabousia tangfeifanii]AOZ72477.1 hypothetical protein BK816_03515 [Boudabousia tangfeifanii]
MKLLRLKFAGIGPFRKEFEVNFENFGDSGIFLLEGPTGSGKSTIIDAISFALFGVVAGLEDSSKDRLRSDHCDDHEPSYVELDFQVDAGTFRIHRSPQYERSDRKTPVSAKVSLSRLSTEGGAESVISNRVKEVALELSNLVGLTKEQFLQTVVLPQGKFQTFLRAEPKERQGVLESIFSTQIYSEITKLLAEKAKTVRAASEQQRRVLESNAQTVWKVSQQIDDQISEISELSLEKKFLHGQWTKESFLNLAQPLVHTAAVSAGLEQASSVSKDWKSKLEEITEVIQHFQERRQLIATKADKTYNDAKILHKNFERGAKAQTLLTELSAQKAEIDSQKKALESHQASQAVLVAIKNQKQLSQKIQNLTAELETIHELWQAKWADSTGEKLRALPFADLAMSPDTIYQELENKILGSAQQIPTTIEEYQPANWDITQVTKQLCHKLSEDSFTDFSKLEELETNTAFKQFEAQLSAAKQTNKAIINWQNESSKASEKQAVLLPMISDLETKLAKFPELQAKLKSELLETKKQADEFPELKVSLKTAKQQADLYAEYASELGKEKRLQTKHQNLEKKRDEQQQNLNNTVSAWQASAAIRMAATLAPNDPCPVCFAPYDPKRAQHDSTEFVPDSAIETANMAFKAAQDKLQESSQALEMVKAKLASLASQLVSTDKSVIAKQLEDTTAKWQAAKTASAKLTRLEKSQADLQKEQEELNAKLPALKAESNQLTRRWEEAWLHLRLNQKYLDFLLGDFTTVESLEQAGSEFKQLAQKRQKAIEKLEENRETLKIAEENLQQTLTDSPFEKVEEALASKLSSQQVADYTDSTTRWQKQLTLAEGTLAEPEVKTALTTEVLPDLQVLADQSSTEKHNLQVTNGLVGQFSILSEQLSQALTSFVQSYQQLEKLELQNAALLRVGVLVAGTTKDNLVGTPLSHYVLRQKLEDVLAATNPLLRLMSDGRFYLERTDLQPGQTTRTGGLGLVIHDVHADKIRATKTLSGGESFMAALALALGLCQVVSAQNGGITIESMFIDEGFGTLSPNYLDTVIAQLTKLSAQGISVGLISHVPALKEQISDRITISPKPDGTSTLRVTS